MKAETIKKYSSEFQHWLDHGANSVLWRYEDDKGEDLWHVVGNDGSPFTLDNENIEFIIYDDKVDLRKAERDGRQLEKLMHNTTVWQDSSTVDAAFLTRSAKEFRVKNEEPKLQYLYKVIPGENGYSTEWNLTGYMTRAEVDKRYLEADNIIEVLEMHDRLKLIKVK